MSVLVDAERHTLEAVVDAYFDTFNASKVDELVALFTPDAVVMADEMPTVTGQEQIRATYAGAFQAMRFDTQCVVDEVIASDDLAVVRTHATGSMTILAGGGSMPMPEHRELFVLRRAGGTWQISQYIFNTAVSKGRA